MEALLTKEGKSSMSFVQQSFGVQWWNNVNLILHLNKLDPSSVEMTSQRPHSIPLNNLVGKENYKMVAVSLAWWK